MPDLLDATTVRTAIDVDVPAERAFQAFTTEIEKWWDAGHHILEAPLATMEFQPYAGGHIIDRGTDGSECHWARVLAYEPPRRVVFSWDINIHWQIETDPSRCSEIEVAFIPIAEAATRVELTHRHLDRHGPGWESMRDAVSQGWSLDGFAAFAAGRNTLQLPAITDAALQERLAHVKPYTVMLLHRTDKCVRPDVDPIIWEHGRRNQALVEAGEMLIVMPSFDDSPLAGIGIFAADVERVEDIVKADPGVRAGIFSYELHPAGGFPGDALR